MLSQHDIYVKPSVIGQHCWPNACPAVTHLGCIEQSAWVVGERDGNVVGLDVGDAVGLFVGDAVGLDVGLDVGDEVGLVVGQLDGAGDG